MRHRLVGVASRDWRFLFLHPSATGMFPKHSVTVPRARENVFKSARR